MLNNSTKAREWESKVSLQMKDFLHLSEMLTDDEEINEDILAYIDAFICYPKNSEEYDYNETIIDALNKELIIYMIVPSYDYLNLDCFGITKLPESLIDDNQYSNFFSKLRSLNLANNELRFLPENIGKLKSLVELNIANNKIVTLPKSINTLSNLKVINTSGNSIKDMPAPLFKIAGKSDKQESFNLHALANNLPSSPSELTMPQSLLESSMNDNVSALSSAHRTKNEPLFDFSFNELSQDGLFSSNTRDSIRQLLDILEPDMYADFAQSTTQVRARRNAAPPAPPVVSNYETLRTASVVNSVYPHHVYPTHVNRVRFYEGKQGKIILPHTDPNSSAPGPHAEIDVEELRALPTAIPSELVTWMQQLGNTPWNFPGQWSYFERAHYALILQEQEEDRRHGAQYRF